MYALRFEVLAELKMSMLVFWVVVNCELLGRYRRFRLSPESGGSISLRNFGNDVQVHMVLQPRKPTDTIYVLLLAR